MHPWIRTIPRPLPGLPSYHVVCARRRGLDAEVAAEALALGRRLSREHYGRGGGFVVLMSGGAGRRRDWPHAHVVAVRSVAHKRVCLALLLVKRRLAALDRLRLAPGRTASTSERPFPC